MLVVVNLESVVERLAIVVRRAHPVDDGWWYLQSIKGGVYGEIHENALIPLIGIKIPGICEELNIQEHLPEIIARLAIQNHELAEKIKTAT